jgi:hypothetical protein
MTTNQKEDYGEIEIAGHYISVLDLVITLLSGAISIFILVLISWQRQEDLRLGLPILASIALIIFFIFLVRSIQITKRYYFKVSKNGVIYHEGHKLPLLFSWNQIVSIRTHVHTLPTLKSTYFKISGYNRGFVFDEYLPADRRQYYYAVALLFMYSTIYRIPFHDHGDLLKNSYISNMGFLYPNLVHHGRYFPHITTAEELKSKIRRCPGCHSIVIPMNIGRCPKCGYSIIRRT